MCLPGEAYQVGWGWGPGAGGMARDRSRELYPGARGAD